jgi:hypothetical protein
MRKSLDLQPSHLSIGSTVLQLDSCMILNHFESTLAASFRATLDDARAAAVANPAGSSALEELDRLVTAFAASCATYAAFKMPKEKMGLSFSSKKRAPEQDAALAQVGISPQMVSGFEFLFFEDRSATLPWALVLEELYPADAGTAAEATTAEATAAVAAVAEALQPRSLVKRCRDFVFGCCLPSANLPPLPPLPLHCTFTVLHYRSRGGSPPYRGTFLDPMKPALRFALRCTGTTVGQLAMALKRRLNTPYLSLVYGTRAEQAPQNLDHLPEHQVLELAAGLAHSHHPAALFLAYGFVYVRTGIGTFGAMDIGVFTDGAEPRGHRVGTLSSAFLVPLPTAAPAPSVSAVAKAAGGKPGATWQAGECEALPLHSCSALMQAADKAWQRGGLCTPLPPQQLRQQLHPLAGDIAEGSTMDDFKLLLTAEELEALIGSEAAQRLYRALDGSGSLHPHAIAIRRTRATGKWIEWHTDAAARTLCVPLNGSSEYVGGQLLLAEVGKSTLGVPKRTAGAWIVHDGDLAHAVTRLERGVRYGLFLLIARPKELPPG